jgi:prepilin-type N-terminal cleavage/methylation domain-containing protein
MRRDQCGQQQRGATLIEVMIVLAILGIIANIGVRVALDAQRRAEATRIVSDFVTFRRALFDYVSQENAYPPDVNRGTRPPELERELPKGMDFRLPELGVLYDYENWVRRDGRPKHPRTGVAYAFSVVVPKKRHRRIYADIARVYDGRFERVASNRYSFIIERFE